MSFTIWWRSQTMGGLSYDRLKSEAFAIFPVLVIFGSFDIWVGGGSLTLPWALFVLLPLVVIELGRGGRSRIAKSLLPFILLYLAMLASAILALGFKIETSIQRNLASLLPLAMALLVLVSFKDVNIRPCLKRVMLWSGGLLAALVFIKVVQFVVQNSDGWHQLAYPTKFDIRLPLGMSNYLAVYLVFFSVFAFRYSKLVWSLCLLATFATLSRFGTAFIILAMLTTWSLRFLRLEAVLGILFVLVMSVVLPVFIFPDSTIMLARDVGLSESILSRFELWGAALDSLKISPLWGGGPGGFTTYLELVNWHEGVWGTHNIVLSTWIDYGFPGLLAYILIVGCFFFQSSRLLREQEELTKLGLAMLLVYGLFENVGSTTTFEMLFAYLICLLAQPRSMLVSTESNGCTSVDKRAA